MKNEWTALAKTARGSRLADDLSKLAGRLAPPPRLYCHGRHGVLQPPASRGRRLWVISRGLCQFSRIDHIDGSGGARWRSALALEIARLSPFADTGSHVDLGPTFASLWIWDRQTVAAAAAELGIDAQRLRVLPETALLPPLHDGLRLLAALDGFEGQYWVAGRLAGSRWWAAPPDAQAWMLFQRGAAVPADQLAPAPPTPEHPAWLRRPWTQARGGARFVRPGIAQALSAAAFLAVLACGYLGAAALRLDIDTRSLAGAVAERSEQVRPLLDARTTAYDNLAEIRRFRDFDRFPGQLEVMAELVRKLPSNEARFTEWTFDRGQLEVMVAADHPLDTVSLVRALAVSPLFKDVAVERHGDQSALRIRLSVVPKW
jgi:hypothetical protein